MLRVYRKADKNVYDTERFFNQNIKRFDIASEEAQRLLWKISRTLYEGNGKISTPFGNGTLKELDIPCKLALCLMEFPTMLFCDWGCSENAMETILNLNDGSLLITRKKPYSYYFGVKCLVNGKKVITSSTELNIFMHMEDTNVVRENVQ